MTESTSHTSADTGFGLRAVALAGVALILVALAFPWATTERSTTETNLTRGTSSTTSDRHVSVPATMLIGRGHDKGDAMVAAVFIVPILAYGALLAFGKVKPLRIILLVWSLLIPSVFISTAVEHNRKANAYRPATPTYHQGYTYVGGTESRPVRTPFPIAPCVVIATLFGLLAAESFGLRTRPTPGAAAPAGATDKLAIWSISLAAGSFVLGPLTGIPAIVCGHKALKRIPSDGGRGSGLAIGGLVIGYLVLLGFLAAVILPIVTR